MERPAEERGARSPAREIHHGSRFVVTRALGSHRRPVVEKTVQPDYGDPEAVAALIHESAVLKRVEGPGVAKIVAVRTFRALPVLVLEDAGPSTLRERTRRPFDVDAFLDLALRLAEILAHVHGCDVIHRDINPSNIVLDASGAPTLIDFDRSVVGSTATPAPQDDPRSLPYASPEQLGRVSRLVDRRSDLYSLGTVLYETLTGGPPFRSDDALEIVHAHLARVPVSPSLLASGIPRVLSGIVLKLLAKMPEARYQTAAALAADLRAARHQWKKTGTMEPFELGTLDLALELPLPDRLYGRDSELGVLRAALDRVAHGPRELVLISGEEGVGKSTLVGALRDEVVGPSAPAATAGERRGRFVAGKVDLRAANAPFASLVQALGGLVAEVRGEPADRRDAWRERILRAVGDNGRVLTELLPELEEIIGRPPALGPLEPFEAQTRLYVTLQAFLQAFASEGRPLVVFLDDLQWADAASLDALRALASDPESKHVLFLGAFRPRDVDLGHPLSRFEVDLKRARTTASRVESAPLGRAAIEDLLSEALRSSPSRVGPLAELLAAKTAGNPFFLRQLLGSLHKSGLLAFDLGERKWTWAMPQIERVGITENVVELLLEAIRRLPDETRELLPIAACIGRLAGLGVLEAVAEKPREDVRAALLPALREGLLVTDPVTGGYLFAHDRVQAAAYSLLSESRRKELHVRIGRVLEGRTGARAEDATFEAVDHINLGAELITDPAERLALARLNHGAGLKAKASAAYGPALTYLQAGLASLPAGAWHTEPALTMLLQREAAECAYLSGDYALSDRLVEEALEHATSTVEKADLHGLRVVSATVRAAWKEALDHGQRALAELGYTLSSGGDMEEAIAEEQAAAEALLAGRSPAVLRDLPSITDPADQAVLRLLVNLAHPAWWYRDRGLFRLLAFRTLRFILERGHGPESPTALCDVAMCLSCQDQFDEADAFGSVAQDLAWRFGHTGQQAHAYFLYAAFVQRWRHPYAWIAPRLRRAFDIAKKAGEMRSAAYALSAMVFFNFASGRELDDLLRQNEEDMPFLRRTRNEGILSFQLCYRQEVRCLKGLTSGRNRFSEPGFDEEAFLRAAEVVPTLVCLYWIRRLHTSFIFRDFGAAHGYAEAAAQLMESMAGYVPAIDFIPFSSLCYAALCDSAPEARRREWLAAIAQNQERLARWAESCPANFRHLHLLVEAEVARLERRFVEASDLYDQSIEAATEGGFVPDAAVACELAGRHALARARVRIADMYLRKARERYARWGATEKVRALEEEFPEMGRSDSVMPTGPIREGDLDVLSLLKSAEPIATEVVLDRLLERLIHVCAEAAGADRVVVVLEEDGRPVVRAQGTAAGRVDLEPVPLEAAPVARHAIAQARSTRRPMVVGDAVHDPRVVADPYVSRRAMRSILALPVQRGAALVATLYFENNLVTNSFTPPRLRVLELLSAQIAAALENSLLFERLNGEVATRRRAEDTVRFLANAGAELAESLDAGETAARLARIIVPKLADWCCVDMVDDNREIRRLAIVHADPAKNAIAADFGKRGVPDWTSPQPPAVVLRTGAPLLVPDVTEQSILSMSRDREHLAAVQSLGVKSVLSVPMIAHGRTVGAITCVLSRDGRRYGPDDMTVAQELARRAALAIDNARLFQKAQDAVRVREEFLSVAAHELHTPITSLHLMMQALSRGGVPITPENVRQTLGVADRQVRRLIRLIDELLDVSRIEASRFHIERETLDLATIGREVVERMTDDASRSGSQVTCSADAPVIGSWDRTRLEQVVANLLSNAIKFGAGRPIEVRVTGADGEARLAVIDHGIGVPADRESRIFERFERGVSSRQYGGLGLGLYIVRSIVERLGGEVGVDPTPGGGSTFHVELPCEPPDDGIVGLGGGMGD